MCGKISVQTLLFGSLLLLLCFSVLLTTTMTTYPVAEAHFFGGQALNTGKYQITFVPYPSNPTAGSNSTTLNFSVLENNSNIYNIYSSLTIAKKGTGDIIAQYPYKSYEFSDITIPFAYKETGDYTFTFQTRINADPK